ncbi:MAG: lipase [Rhodopirellula sp. TMED11]|nr:MAG: lipase [Rhodopirellula sp. TMED11]
MFALLYFFGDLLVLRSHFPTLLGCVVFAAWFNSLAPAQQPLAKNPTAQQRSGQQLSGPRTGDQPATPRKRLAAKYLQTDGKRDLEVTYKTVGDKALKLDLYYPKPKPDQPVPVVVFTHGGGWAAGSRYKAASGLFARVFTRLLDEGFAVAPVSYRLAKKDSNVAMRDCVIDCKDAIRYLAKHSDTLGIDPQQVFVMGDSAGGHLAQMLLLTSPDQLTGDPDLKDASYHMVAGVSWYGPADFETTDLFNHDDRANFRDRFGPRIMQSNTGSSDKLTRYREVSPVNYLTKDSAPLLMIQGDKDTTIPVKHAYFMQKKAKQIGAPVEVMIIRNSGHNWRAVDGKVTPTTDEIVKRTVDFLIGHKP